MGYNTVFFGLNDHMIDALKSPKAYAYLIAHGDLYANVNYRNDIFNYVNIIARENGEPPVNDYVLRAIKTFHADNVQYFQAGRNSMEVLEVENYMSRRNHKTGEMEKFVVLRLPR